MTEEELFVAWRSQPDSQLAQELYATLLNHALGIIVKTIHKREPELAHDAVAEAMVNAKAFEGGSAFSTWFQAIVNNQIRMRYRTFMRREGKEIPEHHRYFVGVQETQGAVDLELSLEAMLGEEERELLRQIVEGRTQKEIGEGEMTRQGVGKRIKRLREKIEGGLK